MHSFIHSFIHSCIVVSGPPGFGFTTTTIDCPLHPSRTSCTRSSLREQMTTLSPCLRNSSASAFPIPLVPPVTMTFSALDTLGSLLLPVIAALGWHRRGGGGGCSGCSCCRRRREGWMCPRHRHRSTLLMLLRCLLLWRTSRPASRHRGGQL